MINRELTKATLLSFGTYDAYGQKKLNPDEREIEVMIKPYSQNVMFSNPIYNDAQFVAITKADITDANVIEIDGTQYKVLYVIRTHRWNTALMTKN